MLQGIYLGTPFFDYAKYKICVFLIYVYYCPCKGLFRKNCTVFVPQQSEIIENIMFFDFRRELIYLTIKNQHPVVISDSIIPTPIIKLTNPGFTLYSSASNDDESKVGIAISKTLICATGPLICITKAIKKTSKGAINNL